MNSTLRWFGFRYGKGISFDTNLLLSWTTGSAKNVFKSFSTWIFSSLFWSNKESVSLDFIDKDDFFINPPTKYWNWVSKF